jgi:hypothetical protein
MITEKARRTGVAGYIESDRGGRQPRHFLEVAESVHGRKIIVVVHACKFIKVTCALDNIIRRRSLKRNALFFLSLFGVRIWNVLREIERQRF